MTLRIELNGVIPGIAKLSAAPWQYTADIEIMIQRNQDNYYLTAFNQWGPETCWHNLDDLLATNGRLEGNIDPWLVDSLLAQGGNCKFLLHIREHHNPNNSDFGVINIKNNVLASNAVANNPTDIGNSVEVSPPQPIEIDDNFDAIEEIEPLTETVIETPPVVEPPPVIETTKPPVTNNQQKSNLGKKILIGIGLLLLICLALTLYSIMTNNSDQDKTDPNMQLGNCELDQINQKSELEFIQACLQTKPSNDAIIELIKQAKNQQKCNIAQRLYANQSQQNANIALLYAKEYDEKYYSQNSCFTIDKNTAIYWYETALDLDRSNVAAKTRLAELKQN